MNYSEILDEARSMVGKGWWPILDEYLPQIAELVPDGEVYVKEKFGVLRIQPFGPTTNREKLYELINLASKASSSVCEECGRRAKLRPKRIRMQTLCYRCNRLKEY